MHRRHQSGNAVLLILIGVALFGALAYTFTRGAKTGQGNLTDQQARLAAQELIGFFSMVDRATDKLRSKGCPESDISFSSSKDTGNFVTSNTSATSPADKSCHVFETNGGGVTMNMDWKKYQIPYDQIPIANQAQYDNSSFIVDVAIAGLGTSSTDLFETITFVKPEICGAFNTILGITSSTGNPVYCVYSNPEKSYGQIVNVWSIR